MAPKSKGSPCLPLLALLCLISTLVVSATTSSCVEPSIVKAEKEMWKAERLLSADGQPTRWMAEEGGFFVMHLGCQKIVKGFRIDNSQHKNKEGNKKDSFAFEILVRHAVAVLLQCCCYAVAMPLLCDCLLQNQTKLMLEYELSQL